MTLRNRLHVGQTGGTASVNGGQATPNLANGGNNNNNSPNNGNGTIINGGNVIGTNNNNNNTISSNNTGTTPILPISNSNKVRIFFDFIFVVFSYS